MIDEVKSLKDLQKEINENRAILTYFYNDNCAPCISLRPKIIDLINEYFPLIKLVFINSEIVEIPSHYNVFDKPTLIVFFDRKEFIRESKYLSIIKLRENIDRYYRMVFE